MSTTINGTTGINKIQDGTITNADINASAAIAASKLSGTGKVLQVVNDTDTGAAVTTTSSSWQDISGLSCQLTTTETNSKVLIYFKSGFARANGDRLFVDVKRVISGGATTDELVGGSLLGMIQTRTSGWHPISAQYLDSPNVASGTTLTYTLRFKNNDNTTSVSWGYGNESHRVLMIQEIGA